jgi:hypothetical protein
MTGTSRYASRPERLAGKPDIQEYVLELFRRIGAGETSLQIGHTAIEDGDLIVRNGDIVVSESDDSIVLKILHGFTPEIRFWPLGVNDTHRVAIFAFDAGSAENPDQALEIVVEETDATADGGKLLLFRGGAVLSHMPDGVGGEESYLWLNAYGDQIADYRGRWTNQQQSDNNQGLYMGGFTASAGVSTWTHSYFSTFATGIFPVCTVGRSGSTLEWVLDGFNTSSFTLRFSTTTGDKAVTFWNFRV